jgi:hypothetical protein
MKPPAVVFMILTWAAVVWLNVSCIRKLLSVPKK